MKRILFVDDEPKILEGLERLLFRARAKWSPSFVGSGSEALEALERERFDVLVTDMRMPGMDGAELLRHVHAQHPHLVRIVLSGHTELAAALRAMPIAHQFLSKPCDAKTLLEVLERACSLQGLITDDVVRTVVGGVADLPARPRVYSELTAVLADEQWSMEKVTGIVERDVAISSKLLHLVNSAFFGPRQRVMDVQGAVKLLGTSMLRHVVLSIEVFEEAGRAPAGFSMEEESRHALAVAGLAKRLADGPDGNDAFLAGLLHDLGVLVIATRLPDYFAEITAHMGADQRPMHAVERELRGVTHAEIGAYLVGLWGMPYPIVEAVANHHVPERCGGKGMSLPVAVSLASRLVREASPNARRAEEPIESADLERLGVSLDLQKWRRAASALLAD